MRRTAIFNLNLVLLSLFGIILSYIKFSPCINENFSGLAATSRGCYSDIPIFWSSHLLEAHLWPYQFTTLVGIEQIINPIEYPFLTGLVIWIISFITLNPDTFGVSFFLINSLINSFLFIATVLLINKIKPKSSIYFALAPAVFFSIFINWDLYAVATTLLAIYFYDKNKLLLSAFFLATAVSFKFYPIVLFFAILIIGVRRKQIYNTVLFVLQTFMFFILINIIPILIDFKGWLYFYQVSLNRKVGSGSLWEFLALSGIEVKSLNYLAVFATFLTYLVIAIYFFKFHEEINLATMAFLCVFAFVLFNKVYSPQFVIWLTALAVFVLNRNIQKYFFVLWQFSELVFHFAIWRYLYWQGFGNKTSGISDQTFKWLIAFRILCLLLFVSTLILRNRTSQKEFSG
jgi:hypothetical protein